MSERLDVRLVGTGLARSRGEARELIDGGAVLIDGRPALKAAQHVSPDARVEIAPGSRPRWVGRAAGKLDAAFAAFGPDGLRAAGRRCLDVGASTGGFTQVLLERGAAHVVALDVGHGQLHARLRSDPRVVLRERVNARLLTREDVPEPCALLVADVSFISLRLVLPAAVPLLSPGAEAVLLVKPQFESERGEVGRGGIVREPGVRSRALARVVSAAEALGLSPLGTVESPITGADGNVELLAGFRKGAGTTSG